MHIEYINDFLLVAKTKSLTKASLQMNISTPALSKRIHAIESYFNVKLFVRNSKGIFLTKDGEEVLELLKKVQIQFETAKMNLNNKNKTTKIGCLPSVIHNSEFQINKKFAIIFENNTTILLESLKKGELDLIIGNINYNNDSRIHHKMLYTDNFYVVFNNVNPLVQEAIQNKALIYESIKRETILCLNPPCDTYIFLNKYFEHNDFIYQENIESILAHIKISNYITLLPQKLLYLADNHNLLYFPLTDASRSIGYMTYDRSLL